MLFAHLDEHGFDSLAPFKGGHWDDRLDAGITLVLAFDELDFLDVLAAAFPEVGVTFEENHRLDIELAAVPSVVFDVVGVAEKLASLESRVCELGLVPDMQMRVDDREVRHQRVSLKLVSTGLSVKPKPGGVSLRSMNPSLATGPPSKMYQKTSTGTLGKCSEIGPA